MTRKRSRVDVVWRTRKEEVLQEIKSIIGANRDGDGDPTPGEEFRHRTTAAKNVYDRLSAEDKADVEKQLEKVEIEPNPPEIQQR